MVAASTLSEAVQDVHSRAFPSACSVLANKTRYKRRTTDNKVSNCASPDPKGSSVLKASCRRPRAAVRVEWPEWGGDASASVVATAWESSMRCDHGLLYCSSPSR
eukprot:5711972-Amphidinium_carterae.2